MKMNRLAMLLFTGLLLCGNGNAQQSDAARLPFNIQSQRLDKALTAFAQTTGMQLLFPTDVAMDRQAPQVSGSLTADAALRLLLKDSGLSYKYVNAKTVAINPRKESVNGGKQDAFNVVSAAGIQTMQAAEVPRPQPGSGAATEFASAAETGEVEVISTKIDGLNKKSIFDATEEGALPYNVLDREEIERSGATNLEELFRNVPEFANYGSASQERVIGLASGNTYAASAMDLRGFGAQQTVVLVNGRRMSQGTFGVAGPDISRIPIESIERVEILPAAAAAVYGGGAVGGAINIILRKDHAARELTANVGSAAGGAEELRMSYLDGRGFNEGRTRLTTSIDFSSRQPLYARERDYLDRAREKYTPTSTYMVNGRSAFERYILPAFATMPGVIVSNSNTLTLGIPGNPTARYAAIPAGLDNGQSMTLTRASFTPTAGTMQYGERFSRNLLRTPQDNYSLQAQLEHDILSDGRLSLFAEASVTYQAENYEFTPATSFALDANHAYNPFRDTDGTGPIVGVPVIIYLDESDLPAASDSQDRRDGRLTIGLKGKATERWEWMADISAQITKAVTRSSIPGNWVQYLSNSGGAGSTTPAPLATRFPIYNPLRDHSVYPFESQYAYLLNHVRESTFKNRNAEASFRVVGNVWDLPAGALQVSPGGDMRVDDNLSLNPPFEMPTEMLALIGASTSNVGFVPMDRSATYTGAYVEATIPIISPKWQPVPLHSFELSLSRRWDDSNRSKQAVADTYAARLGIVKDVMFRASVTEGFVPNRYITDTFTTRTNFSVSGVQDPMRENTPLATTFATHLSGNNPDLRTEFARSRNFGVMLRPRFIPGLMVNVNHFSTERFDTPASVSVNDLLLFPNDYPADRVVRAPLTATDIQNNYTGGVITYIDVRRVNLTKVELRGVDYSLTYSLPLPVELGALEWSARATNNRLRATQIRSSSTPVDSVNYQGNPLTWRGSSNVYWRRDRLSAGLTANYINAFFGPTTAPSPANTSANGIDGRKIPHQLTFDLQLGYETPLGSVSGSGWQGWLNGTDLRVGILNVLDKMPPLVTDGNAFYSRYADPRQRYIYAQVKKYF